MKLSVMFACLWVLAAPAAAQYKVVDPDGRITYTDRPLLAAGAKVTPMRRDTPAVEAPEAPLPVALRQVAVRFPVTLYSTGDCPACDSGRQLLQHRGVPYAERRIVTETDAAALEAATGSRTVPTLTVGTQALRGMSSADWASYLDAAGYPRESRLPKGWQAPTATPLTERATPAAPPPPPPPPVAAAAPERAAPIPAPGGVRF